MNRSNIEGGPMQSNDLTVAAQEMDNRFNSKENIPCDDLFHLPIGDSRGGWLLGLAFGNQSRFKVHRPSQLDLAFKIGMTA